MTLTEISLLLALWPAVGLGVVLTMYAGGGQPRVNGRVLPLLAQVDLVLAITFGWPVVLFMINRWGK